MKSHNILLIVSVLSAAGGIYLLAKSNKKNVAVMGMPENSKPTGIDAGGNTCQCVKAPCNCSTK